MKNLGIKLGVILTMLCITSDLPGGTMYVDNYYDTGMLIVDPNDPDVPYWENSEHMVVQDSRGNLKKYDAGLNKGIDYTFDVPGKAKKGSDKWFEVTNPDTTSLSIINSDTSYGNEPMPHTGLRWRNSQRKSRNERVNADTSSEKSVIEKKTRKTSGRLSPTEKVIAE